MLAGDSFGRSGMSNQVGNVDNQFSAHLRDITGEWCAID